MKKGFVILLGGMPAAGKTTLGRNLAKELGVPFFDKDLLCDDYTNFVTERETYPNDRHSDFYRNHLRDLEYHIMLKQAYEHAEEGLSSVCISPFTSEFQSDEKIIEIKNNLAKKNPNFTLVTVALTLSAEETKERMIARGRKEDDDKLNDWDNYINSKLSIKFSKLLNLKLENGKNSNTIEEIKKYLTKLD